MMDRKEKERLIEKAESSEMWVLEMRISTQNWKLQQLAGQGVLSDDKKWRKLVLKRNIYRKILLEKYKEWVDGGLRKESNPSYEDYMRSVNYNRHGEEDK